MVGEIVAVEQHAPARRLRQAANHVQQVDLPHPEGPMMETNSPGKTSTLTPRSAGTSTLPWRYIFHRFSVLSIGSNSAPLQASATSEVEIILVAFGISA